MVDLPEEAVEMFNNEDCDKSRPLVWISTVGVRDKEGSPHLAPVCFTKVLDRDKILVAINFATQTMYNIKPTPGWLWVSQCTTMATWSRGPGP